MCYAILSITYQTFRCVFASNFIVPGQIVKRIISSNAKKHIKSNLNEFPLYINVIHILS